MGGGDYTLNIEPRISRQPNKNLNKNANEAVVITATKH